MKNILIVGASSDIARAVAREYASHGYSITLASRNSDKLKSFVKDLQERYSIYVSLIDFNIARPKLFRFEDILENENIPNPNGIIITSGYMPEQHAAFDNSNISKEVVDANFAGPLIFLNAVAHYLQNIKGGFIVGISSVAGDRGRKKNFIYGSSKAGFSEYLSGLRNYLYEYGVQVLTVKPGFVNTAMTEKMELPDGLVAQPKEVATDIYKAQTAGKDILYTKWVWRYIMAIVRLIPERVFKKMDI